jgi:pantetheine-phosphate adenylyltransferase
MKPKILLYPGSFDPPTVGHFDIMERGLTLCEKLIVGISRTRSGKSALFTDKERKVLFESYLTDKAYPVEVVIYEGLTVDLATKLGAFAILRGLRTYSDFEHEFQMAAMNKHLNENLETIFIRTDERRAHVSSSLVKDVALFADVSSMVSPLVQEYLSRLNKKPSE